ncbi:hypothetical protein BJX63DRAFT_438591 [Aspergillus granulosus]|uniref:Uncharacterized protein n=1 Tax=Aspergillus granulosus TaxID=176169 RepID=A0ABR4GRN2_9EURO
MRLANPDECIQDALITREKLESQINSFLEKNQHAVDASRAQDKLGHTNAVSVERKQLPLAAKRKKKLIASIKARKEAMGNGIRTQENIAISIGRMSPTSIGFE